MEGTDDFAEYGKPLEPLDEDSLPRKKPFSLEDQVARDEKGRRRFHGAFTGGFSAGYWNTVGSFEGWQPAEFKSSRTERAKGVQQKPQDFMDREDMGEFGIAPNRVIARDEYSSDSRKRPIPEFDDGPIPGRPVLQDILRPVRETVGVRLLKQMGWRQGQGVGPRVTAVEKRRTYGCAPPPGTKDDSDSDLETLPEDLTFAPDDVQSYIVTPKKDNFGLGYTGLENRLTGKKNISTGLKMTTINNKKVDIKGQAFGVGAFEEDDDDIYSREDVSNYDFSLTDEVTVTEKPQRTLVGVLDGFIIASLKVVKKIYPPPPMPKNYKPFNKGLRSRWGPALVGTVEKTRKTIQNADTRAISLGEERKIIETVTTEDIERRKSTLEMVKDIKIAPSVFKPFASDPDKQKRYEQYQHLVSIGAKDKLCDLQPITMGSWERKKEEKEFDQAALIFKPLTGVMEDRFTQASQVDDISNPLATVEKMKHGTEDQRNAAKMKMFGALTRVTLEWVPCSLLCKRFNVPEPNAIVTNTTEKKKTKYSIFENFEAFAEQSIEWTNAKEKPTTATKETDMMINTQSEIDVENISLPPESSGSTQSTNLPINPASKIDLFKAIFLDSSDEEPEDESEGNKTSNEPNVIPQVTYDNEIRNDFRNTSPPKGLFENLDFDKLFKPVEKSSLSDSSSGLNILPETTKKPQTEVEIRVSPQLETQDIPADSYGPKLPDCFSKKPETFLCVDNSNDDLTMWIERKVHKSKKSKKEKHKHKKKKKKK